ncbi:alpha/beta hydrolase [Aquihabitans sp. G128]|uniref:alpha/beta fold hydrolase n=1 Tax=Aquihabitans sp. G128 TaxID=2849779 RepID=UPI001C23EBE8|nr:alpha/beta fold hydrolase [Aquihabitans sp. G128]QXC59258.1 alpha/beta hydrolase [Aquihabitans sp. G128]
MPFADAADGTRIAYHLSGNRDGEPLLMIQGLGADSRGWTLQKRALSRFRLILVDNRGVGDSDRPPGPYDLEVMAADAVAVLDHAGYGSAHVIGASMGGIISQVLAVRFPDRVRSLVLACTACHHFEWRRELLSEWAEQAQGYGMREFVRRNLRWLVGPRSLRRLAPALAVLGPLAFSVPVSSFVAQIRAILDMDDGLRGELGTIAVPTLVLVGSQDVLTTQGDGEEIASLIPGAELAIVRGGAHLFQVEQAKTFNHLVSDFLARVQARPGVLSSAVTP